MCFFKKKTKAVKNKNDRELIERNANAIEALLTIAPDDIKEELKKLCEQVKYTTSLSEDKAYNMDNKIKNLIEDIKIELVKDKDGDKAKGKIESLVKELKLAVAERKALV